MTDLQAHEASRSFHISSIFYRKEWQRTGHRRTKNFICLLEVAPHEKTVARSGDPRKVIEDPEGKEPSAGAQRLREVNERRLRDLESNFNLLKGQNTMAPEVATHILVQLFGECVLNLDVFSPDVTFDELKSALYDLKFLECETGRFSVALSLREAESVRRALHIREKSGNSLVRELDNVHLSLRALVSGVTLLDNSPDFEAGPIFQQTIHEQLPRFLDCYTHFTNTALSQLLFPLASVETAVRKQYFNMCVTSKRRLPVSRRAIHL